MAIDLDTLLRIIFIVGLIYVISDHKKGERDRKKLNSFSRGM